MKRAVLLVVGFVLLLGGSVAAKESRTLNGEFLWTQRDHRGDLEAVFTPTGESSWDVSFHFSFRGKPRTYSGTAAGSLSEGNLAGEVKNEDEKRTFSFRGSFENGTFSGTHAELENGKPFDTGTLTLKE